MRMSLKNVLRNFLKNWNNYFHVVKHQNSKSSKKQLQELLDEVTVKANLGLRVNAEKTKCMATSDSPLSIKCGNQNIGQIV
jgi:hypothetical protein